MEGNLAYGLAAALTLTGGWMWAAMHTDRMPRVFDVRVGGRPQALRVLVASAWVNGRCGLLNHLGLAAGTGLWLKGARHVHTRGMQFVVDAVFMDRRGRVLAIESYVPAGVVRRGPAGTQAVLELGGGDAARLDLTIGTLLELQ